MSSENEKPTFVFLNVGERMEGTQPIGGQLWINENRKMAATSTPFPGMSASRENRKMCSHGDACWNRTQITRDRAKE
jgi:hypothetical protein